MSDPLDLGPIEPGVRQDWNETWAEAHAALEAARRRMDILVTEGEQRYHTDPIFRRRVTILADVMLGGTRSRRIPDAIRGLVALEETFNADFVRAAAERCTWSAQNGDHHFVEWPNDVDDAYAILAKGLEALGIKVSDA